MSMETILYFMVGGISAVAIILMIYLTIQIYRGDALPPEKPTGHK